MASLLVNHFSINHEVFLLTRQASKEFFYPVDPKVTVIEVLPENELRNKFTSPKYVWALKNQISNGSPDLIISFMTETNILSIIALLLSRFFDLNFKSKLKVSERTDPTRHKIRPILNFLRFIFYRFSSGLILQSKAVVPWGEAHIQKSKISIIPNPIDIEELKRHSIKHFKPEFDNFILHIGRFTIEKGQDFLIESFYRVAEVEPNVRLILIGEGPEKEQLVQKVSTGKFVNRILFLNNKTNVYDYLQSTKLFVLCSRYEGFPNVLMEALASGTPSISVDCKSGPSELLKGKMTSYLVPENDLASMTEKILEVLADENAREKFREYSTEIKKEYSTEIVAAKWLS